ncbi:hypothetical protein [Verrucomicrobium spinosum]|uniref:hypothetical protein n=2 Tax=Verrucomicrobium spinosum TaxID=2736 RepID=UPI0001746948|nr:hypothetical protein [Verrucomicrobium spinosum]
MAIEWLINDETPEHWGVTLGTLTRNNQAVDVLSLPINRAADAVIPFDYDQVITLKRDGEPYFRGRVMSRVVSGESAGDGMTIEVGGPWWELSRMPYVVLTLSVEETPEKTYRLRSNMSGGVRQTSLQMIQQVLDYAVGKGLGFQLQEEPYVLSSFKPPRTTKQDRRCDELIRSALTAHPDTVVWFDYSTEPPTFRLTTRGDEGTTISFTKGVPPLRAVNLQPRPDLVPSGVVVRYERSGTAVSTDGKRPAVLVDAYPPESEPDVLDAIAMTITLKKGEHALAGYAQRLYTAFSVMPWEGGVQLWAADGVTGLHPGQSLNITSDQASWATMGAMVQTVQESLDNGFVNVSLGLPQYCGYKPTIWTITRRQHEDQRVDTIDSGETEEYAPEFEETVPSTGLTVYAADVNVDTGTCQIRVSPGWVSASHLGTEEDEIPPTLDTTELDFIPPPYIALGKGGTVTVWLELEITPTMTEMTFTDAEGEEVVEFRPTTPMTFDQCRIVSGSMPDEQMWDLDYETGEVNLTLKLALAIGSASWPVDQDGPTVNPENDGNVVMLLIPPGGLIRVRA